MRRYEYDITTDSGVGQGVPTERQGDSRESAVKEQSSGLYAQTLAERGFLTIAFDPSYTGESGGEPRYVSSPDINTEDFSAAVDYLMTRDGGEKSYIPFDKLAAFYNNNMK